MWRYCATPMMTIDHQAGENPVMSKFFEYVQRCFLRRRLKKRIAALKNFRHTDEDILDDEALQELDSVIAEGSAMLKAPAKEQCKEWEKSSDEVLNKYNENGFMREVLDVLAVALMVAFGVRALFFQPFKIPTSSMQPTLYGIHYIDIDTARELGTVSPLLGKNAVSDYLLFASQKADLELKTPAELIREPYPVKQNIIFDATVLPFSNGKSIVLPGTPDKVASYTNLRMNQRYSGRITKGFLSDGDHLFVNRLSLHFREPQRGDVMVFSTAGIKGPRGERPSLSGDYYIKRLVGLPGDTLKIVNDVLFVKPRGAASFVPVYVLAPNMSKLYSGRGGYQGHSNYLPGDGSNYLRTPHDEFTVPDKHYFMLGDNTKFSADSRVWGAVPRRNLIGRPAIVFWPFSRRWGTVDRHQPVDVPTGESNFTTFPSMYFQ